MRKMKKWRPWLFAFVFVLLGSLAMANVRAEEFYDFGSKTQKADRLEAEAHNTDHANVCTTNPYDSGSSVQLRNGQKLTFQINVKAAGNYVLKYGYFTDSNTARMTVSVNGGAAQDMGVMRPNGLSSTGGGKNNSRMLFFENFQIQLQAGENTVVIANAVGNTDVDFIELYKADALYYYPIECQQLGMQKVGERVEAEWGYATDISKYTNAMNGNNVSGCVVGLGGSNATAATMNYTVVAEKAGTYYLQICNSGSALTCKQTWTINGAARVLEFQFDLAQEGTGCMQTVHRFEVELKEGVNTISFTRNTNGVSTDYFRFFEIPESNLDRTIQGEDCAFGVAAMRRRVGIEIAKEIYIGYKDEIVSEVLDGYYPELHNTRPATVEVPVTIKESGWYDMYARIYTGARNCDILISLDGGEFKHYPVNYTNGLYDGKESEKQANNVYRFYLEAGDHKFVMKKDPGVARYPAVDWLHITKAAIQSANTTLELDYGESYDVGNAVINVGSDGIVTVENGKIDTLKVGTTTVYHQIQMGDKSHYLYARPYTVVVNKIDFANTELLVATDQTVTYNGVERKEQFASAPEGWTIKYSYGNGNYTDAGIYDVAVQFIHEGYNTVRKDVTLTILPGDYTGNELLAADTEYGYNGEKQSLEAKAPEGWTIEYVNNGRKNAGSQLVTVRFNHQNYGIVTKQAKLTIRKAVYSGTDIILKDAVFEQDGKMHSLTASAPDDWTVTYENHEQSKAGEYQVTAVFEHVNYETITKSATLTIKEAAKEVPKGDTPNGDNSKGEVPKGDNSKGEAFTGDENGLEFYLLLLVIGMVEIGGVWYWRKKHAL